MRRCASCLAAVALLALSSALARADLAEIVDRTGDSVVGVDVTPGDVRPQALHRFVAGWAFDPAGHVVTSAKMVLNVGNVQVVLEDGRVVPARVVGTDEALDLAVLDAGTRLPALPIGRPDLMRLGEPVSAVTRATDGRLVVRAGM